jgi:hypothetical protein
VVPLLSAFSSSRSHSDQPAAGLSDCGSDASMYQPRSTIARSNVLSAICFAASLKVRAAVTR